MKPEFLKWDGVLDMKADNAHEIITIPDQGLVLQPGRLYLGSTIEYTESFNLIPVLEGRSSCARLGLCVHLTAGFGDCGFRGHWTLELTTVEPLRIYAGIEVCQIAYYAPVGEPTYYHGKYQQQTKFPAPSGLWKDF